MDLGDVDLTDGDEDRVGRLVARTEFTRPEAEAIVRFAKVDRDDRDPETIRAFVDDGDADDVVDGLSTDECGAIRRAMNAADRPKDVVEANATKHPSVIFRHATGRCGHDGDVDATTSPRIKRDECRDMREVFQSGDTVEDVRAEFYRSSNAVIRHVFGRCDHTFENDHGRQSLPPTTCNRMRRAYRENDTASVVDIARAFLRGTGTAHRHLTGDCGHDDVGEPPTDGNGSDPIDEDECSRIRGRYDGGASPSEIAADVGRDMSAIRTHAFGRCRHDGDGCDPRRERITSSDCADIRRSYKSRGSSTVAGVIDDAGVSKGTFYYHAFGDCDHDVTEGPAERSGD